MADLKIFSVDDFSWYVAHDLMEFLNWYHENVLGINKPEDLSELHMLEPEGGYMWSNANITQGDIEALGEHDKYSRGGEGDLMRRDGEIWKRQTFADVLGDEDTKEPYEITSTEW